MAYVAGPYRAETINGITENIQRAREVAAFLWANGYGVICPHLNSAHMDGVAPDEAFLEADLFMLENCDLVVMIPGWENSSGAKNEKARAESLGIAVREFSDLQARHDSHPDLEDIPLVSPGPKKRFRGRITGISRVEPTENLEV